jgi:hypothetical protein
MGLAGMKLCLCLLLAVCVFAAVDMNLQKLNGTHFDIVTVEDYPFINVRTCPDESCEIKPWRDEQTGKVAWSGWIVEIIDFLSKEANFTYTLQLPQGSCKTCYGAADKAVRGHQSGADPVPSVMFAGAYVTGSRLNWTKITAPYSNAPLSLLVKRPEEVMQFWRFAAPFTPALWGIIGTLVTWTSLLFVLLEGDDNESVAFGGLAFDSYTHFFSAFGESLYIFCGFFTGRKQLIPHTRLGKTLGMVYGLLVMFVMTTYMGSAAAVLVADSTIPFPKTVMEFLNPQHSVCVLANSAYANFLESNPKYTYLTLVPKANLFDMAQGLVDGDCQGVIERRMHVEYLEAAAKAGALTGHAESANYKPIKVYDSLADGPQELAVMINPDKHSQDTIKKLSMWITANVANGKIRELYTEHVLFRSEPKATSEQSKIDQIDLMDLLGLFATLGVVFAIVFAFKSMVGLYHYLDPPNTDDPMESFLKHQVAKRGEHQPEWRLYDGSSTDPEVAKENVNKIVTRWTNARLKHVAGSKYGVIHSEARIMHQLTAAVIEYLIVVMNDPNGARKFKEDGTGQPLDGGRESSLKKMTTSLSKKILPVSPTAEGDKPKSSMFSKSAPIDKSSGDALADIVFKNREKEMVLRQVLNYVIKARKESGAHEWLSEDELVHKMVLRIQSRWRRRAYEKRTGQSASFAPKAALRTKARVEALEAKWQKARRESLGGSPWSRGGGVGGMLAAGAVVGGVNQVVRNRVGGGDGDGDGDEGDD